MKAARQLRWVIVGTLFGLFALIVANLITLRDRIDDIDLGGATGPIWFVSRIEFDALVLQRTLTQFLNGAVGAEEVEVRFDLLWSRLASLGQGETRHQLEGLEIDMSVAEELLTLLALNETSYTILPQEIDEGPNATTFLTELRGFDPGLRAISLEVLDASSREARGWRDGLVALSRQNGLLQVLVGSAFVVALAFLFVENRQTSKSLKEKEGLLADAMAANIAKSQFISVMNHELRTPLTSIRGAVALLSADKSFEKNESVRRLFEIAQSNSDHLSALIQDLLDVEKFSVGKFDFTSEPTNLADFVRDEFSTYVAIGQPYDVSFVEGQIANDVYCSVDRLRLRQILTNLVSNAAKYSPAGSTVTISLKQPTDTLILSIADEGIGIAKKDQNKVFDAFYQVDSSNERDVGGTGLGLRITKLMVEQMGGEIWFESELGIGTTFFVSFPCAADLVASRPVPNKEGPTTQSV